MKTPISSLDDAELARQYSAFRAQYEIYLVVWDGLNDEVLTNEKHMRTEHLNKLQVAKIKHYIALIRERQSVFGCEGRIVRRRMEELAQELDRRGYPKDEVEQMARGGGLNG